MGHILWRALASPEMATARADAANCLDVEHLTVGWCDEHTTFDTSAQSCCREESR